MPVRLTARKIEKLLNAGGFILVSQKGSHKKWRHPDTGKQVIVPFHQGKDLPIGTLMSIIKGSGLGDDFFGIS